MRPELQRGLLAAATPLLILLGIVALLLRQGSDRLQAIPALVIGSALLAQTSWSWRRRRRALLAELRTRHPEAKHGGGGVALQLGEVFGAKGGLLKPVHPLAPQQLGGHAGHQLGELRIVVHRR